MASVCESLYIGHTRMNILVTNYPVVSAALGCTVVYKIEVPDGMGFVLLQGGMDKKILSGLRLSTEESLHVIKNTEKFLLVAKEDASIPKWIQKADGVSEALNIFAAEHRKNQNIKGILFISNKTGQKRKRAKASPWKGHFGGRISYTCQKNTKIPILGKQSAKFVQQGVRERVVRDLQVGNGD